MTKTIIERIDNRRFINTQDQLNIDSINYLAQIGLLTTQRASEILG